MSRTWHRAISCALFAGAWIVTTWPVRALQSASSPTIYVAGPGTSLVDQKSAPADQLDRFQSIPAPGVRNISNDAQATAEPWVDSNAWRFQRGMQRVSYATLPKGAAPLAAAEAFAFGVDAIVTPDAADVPELGNVLRFLQAHAEPPLPALANIGVIDDRSEAMGEALNMLTRRNLLYRVVTQPDRRLDLTVRIGAPAFPATALTNPSDFAARVREALGDDKRLVRLYGTSTVIARLTSDDRRARLFLLSYSRNRIQPSTRVRLFGRLRPSRLAAYGMAPNAQLADIEYPGKTTEFTVPQFSTIAIVDLEAAR